MNWKHFVQTFMFHKHLWAVKLPSAGSNRDITSQIAFELLLKHHISGQFAKYCFSFVSSGKPRSDVFKYSL